MHRLRRSAASEAGRLLRVLLVRLGSLSANPGATMLWWLLILILFNP
jgi:hypothetical protein